MLASLAAARRDPLRGALNREPTAARLRARTREVMVRHRRSEVAVLLPRRLAETVLVAPGHDERELYALITERISMRPSSPHGLCIPRRTREVVNRFGRRLFEAMRGGA